MDGITFKYTPCIHPHAPTNPANVFTMLGTLDSRVACTQIHVCLFVCLISTLSDGSPTLVDFSSLEMANSGGTSTLVCSVTGNPIPSADMIYVTNSAGQEVPLNKTQKFDRAYKREDKYRVVVDTSGEEFTCVLTLNDGNTIQRTFVVNVFSMWFRTF